VTLTIDGHEIETERATVAPHASGSVSFKVHADRRQPRSIWRGTDALPADNAFHFVLAPSDPVSLVIADSAAIAPMTACFSRRRSRSAPRRPSRSTSRPPRE
jgi:hypothetical protein